MVRFQCGFSNFLPRRRLSCFIPSPLCRARPFPPPIYRRAFAARSAVNAPQGVCRFSACRRPPLARLAFRAACGACHAVPTDTARRRATAILKPHPVPEKTQAKFIPMKHLWKGWGQGGPGRANPARPEMVVSRRGMSSDTIQGAWRLSCNRTWQTKFYRVRERQDCSKMT